MKNKVQNTRLTKPKQTPELMSLPALHIYLEIDYYRTFSVDHWLAALSWQGKQLVHNDHNYLHEAYLLSVLLCWAFDDSRTYWSVLIIIYNLCLIQLLMISNACVTTLTVVTEGGDLCEKGAISFIYYQLIVNDASTA